MTMRKKLLITIACLSVILCTLVTGTIAWLIDDTQTIVNEFKPSNIDVDLTETKSDFKMVPGVTLDKKATVKVTNDIPCYVFIEVVKANDVDSYIGYAVDTTWMSLDTAENKSIYYKEVTESGSSTFDVLGAGSVTVGNAEYSWTEDKVLVLPNVTKAMMKKFYDAEGNLKSATEVARPTLSFKAYACQKEGFDSAEAAWAEASKTS